MRVLLKLLCFLVVFSGSYFVTPVLQTALAQEALQGLPPDFVPLCEPFPPPNGRPLGVCPGSPSGLAIPGCADRAPATQSEKDEHAFFSVHPELFPDIYKTGTHLNIIAAYNKSGCNLEKFGKDFPGLTPAGFFEDLKKQPAIPTPSSQPPSGVTPVIGRGGQCFSARGREKDPLHNPDNPGSTDTKPKLVPEPCGTTFETYNPPAIACGEKGGIPGVWAIVSRNGDVNGQSIGSCLNNAPGGYVHDCSLQNQCANYTPNTDIQYVFVKPEDPQPSTENLVPSALGDRYLSDSGEIKKIRLNHFTSLNVNKFNFQTGFFSNDQGEKFRDGIPVSGSGSSPGTTPPIGQGTPIARNQPANPGQGQPGLLVAEATRQAAEQQVARVQASLQSTIAKRQAAEQQFNNAQATLTTATAAQETAEQQLATAQATLASATEALKAAEQTVQQEAAEQATMEEQLATAQAELASAEAAQRAARQAAKQALEQKAEQRSREQAARAEKVAKEAAEKAAKMAADIAAAKAAALRITAAEEEAEKAAKEKAEMLAQIAAAEEIRRLFEESARQAAKQAAKEVAEKAAAQAEEQAAQQKAALASAQTASSDARAIRQAAEQALQQAQAQAVAGDPAAKIAAVEAAKKAEEAKLAFTRAAKAANLAAEQAAKEAAEQAAQLASELAAAKSKASRIIAEEEAAAALARQAEAHAAQIQQTWRF